jgi:soluble cytochrome b562
LTLPFLADKIASHPDGLNAPPFSKPPKNPQAMIKQTITAVIAITAILLCAPRVSLAEDKTPLEEKMTAMNKNFKALKKQVDDPAKKDSSIEMIAALKKGAIESKDLDPAKAKDVPAGERAKFIADYKAGMDQMIAAIDKLDKAVRAGDAAGAKAVLEDLTKQKADGHKKFQKDEDK